MRHLIQKYGFKKFDSCNLQVLESEIIYVIKFKILANSKIQTEQRFACINLQNVNLIMIHFFSYKYVWCILAQAPIKFLCYNDEFARWRRREKGEVGRREGGGGRKVDLRRQRSSVRELFDNISYERFILMFRKMFLPEFFPDYYPTALGLFKKLHESALHFFFHDLFFFTSKFFKGNRSFQIACLPPNALFNIDCGQCAFYNKIHSTTCNLRDGMRKIQEYNFCKETIWCSTS